MVIDVLKMPDAAARWWKVSAFLKLRSEVFVQRLGWSLTEVDGLEFEIYDHFGVAHYVVATKGDVVLGGVRLIQCSSQIGPGRAPYSYMIRDAYRGLINLPQDLVFEEPTVSPSSWELTRLVVANEGRGVARRILSAANDYVRSQGGTECLFLGSPTFMRLARGMGFDPVPLGPVVQDTSGEFLAFRCGII